MTGMRGSIPALLCAAALMLGGCGELAYKTGAGAGALQADQRTCKQAGAGQAAYKSCMNEKGWSIAELDADPSPVAPATVAPKRAVAPAAMPMPGATAAAGVPATTAPAMAVSPEVATPPADPLTPVPVTAWVKFGSGDPSSAIADCVAKLGPANAPDKVHKTVTVALLACMREQGWRGL